MVTARTVVGKTMIVYLRSGGKLHELLKPDVDQYTRRVETDEGATLVEILGELGIPLAMVAFAFVAGKVQKLGYVPSEGDVITIQSPVAGG